MPRPDPTPSARTRAFLRPATAVDLARTAADDPCRGPTLVVLLVDADGLLVAARDLDANLGNDDPVESCTTVLDLLEPAGHGAAVVVSLDSGNGLDPPQRAERDWHELRRAFRRHRLELLDWLLVADEEPVSVPRWFGETASW